VARRLEGRVGFVTGGSSGIGRAIVERFIGEGAQVGFTGRDQGKIDAVARSLGSNAIGIRSDISNIGHHEHAVTTAIDAFGMLDTYVANAAVVRVKPFLDVDAELYDWIMGVNLRGLFFGIQTAVKHMKPGGSVVIIGSSMWPKGVSGYSIYNASKGALRSLARVLAAELAEKEIRVNHLSPGVIDTPMIDRQGLKRDAVEKLFLDNIPLRRLGRAEEVASAALFLASEDSSYMTGADLMADGGIAQV